MEETDITEPVMPEQPQGILLLEDAQSFLLQSGKWARFLGVIGFISSAFIALVGLFFGTIMTALTHLQPTSATALPMAFGGAMGFFYILIAVFNFFVALYLYHFGARVKQGILYQDAAEVTQGLGKLKSMFKLLGITTIVMLALYALIFVIVIIAMIIGFSMVRPASY
jgi:hypothetical protein